MSASLSQLTKREAEIYRLMQTHRSLRQIARDLHIDYSTAKTHARHITHKMTRPSIELKKRASAIQIEIGFMEWTCFSANLRGGIKESVPF